MKHIVLGPIQVDALGLTLPEGELNCLKVWRARARMSSNLLKEEAFISAIAALWKEKPRKGWDRQQIDRCICCWVHAASSDKLQSNSSVHANSPDIYRGPIQLH